IRICRSQKSSTCKVLKRATSPSAPQHPSTRAPQHPSTSAPSAPEHPSTSFLSDRSRKHVLERRHAGSEVADLRTGGGREREDPARAVFAGNEHPHDVFFGGVALETGSLELFDKCGIG